MILLNYILKAHLIMGINTDKLYLNNLPLTPLCCGVRGFFFAEALKQSIFSKRRLSDFWFVILVTRQKSIIAISRGGFFMANHDDFVDDYIEYRIFEESMKKGSGGGKPPKRNGGCCGCFLLVMIIIIAVLAILMLGSCSKSSSKVNWCSSNNSTSNSSSDYWDEHQND